MAKAVVSKPSSIIEKEKFQLEKRQPITDAIKDKRVKSLLAMNTCGSCRYFNNIPMPGATKSCQALGVIENQVMCQEFKVSLELINPKKLGWLPMFSLVLKLVPKNKLKLLAAMLLGEAKTREYGFRFGQEVYIKYLLSKKGDDEYITNYARAYVIDANSRYVSLAGKLNRRQVRMFIKTENNSILTEAQWKLKKEELLKEGRYSSPDHNSFKYHHDAFWEKYTPPSIDDFNVMEKKDNNSLSLKLFDGDVMGNTPSNPNLGNVRTPNSEKGIKKVKEKGLKYKTFVVRDTNKD